MSSLTVSGVPVDLSGLGSAANPQTVLNVINTALTPLGLNMQWPTQTTLSDGTVRITPLVIGIDNNALGQQVIGANENSVHPSVRHWSTPCSVPTATSPTRSRSVTSGWACWRAAATSTSTSGAPVPRPTSRRPRPRSAPVVGPRCCSTSSTGNSGGAGSSGSAGGGLAVTGNSGAGALAPPAGNPAPTSPTASGGGGQQVSALGPMTRTSECISLGPAGGGCVTGDAAVPIGLAALGLVVALFTWDCLRQRRRPQLHKGARTAMEAAG